MRASSNDIGGEAIAALLSGTDFSPANSRERNFDPPAPRVLMLAFSLPTQIQEASGRWPVGERTAENRRTYFVSFDIEREIEGACIPRFCEAGMYSAFCVLHPETHGLVQWGARLDSIVDQTDGDLPFLHRSAPRFAVDMGSLSELPEPDGMKATDWIVDHVRDDIETVLIEKLPVLGLVQAGVIKQIASVITDHLAR
jgi:hypothetical protein